MKPQAPKPTAALMRRDSIRDTPMPPKWKGVLWIIHTYCDEKHRGWCSVRKLAAGSGYSIGATHRILSGMAEAGLITRMARWREGPDALYRGADRITIHMQALRKFNFKRWYARHGKALKVFHDMEQGVPRHGTEVGTTTKPHSSLKVVKAFFATLAKPCTFCGVRNQVADGLCGPCIKNPHRKALQAKAEAQ